MPRKPSPRRPEPDRRRKPRPRREPFAEVAAITQTILEHHRAANRVTVEARAEQGRLLLEARKGVRYGMWGTYVATKLPFSRGTADRAVDLYHFREKHPAVFEKLRFVELSMAQFLIQRPIAELTTFLSKAHLVPSLGVKKTPSAMTVAQAMEVLLGTGDPSDGGEEVLRRSRRASRRAIQEIRTLIDHRDDVDPAEVADLYDELVQALAELGVAFGLEG